MNYTNIAARISTKLNEIPLANRGNVYEGQRWATNWREMLNFNVVSDAVLLTWFRRERSAERATRDEEEIAAVVEADETWKIIHIRQFVDNTSEALFQADNEAFLEKFRFDDMLSSSANIHRSEPLVMDSARVAVFGEEVLVHISEFTLTLTTRDTTP